MSDKKSKNWIANAKFLDYLKNNKGMQIAVVVLCFAIMLGIFLSTLDLKNPFQSQQPSKTTTHSYVTDLENRLENIISNISGAGNVNVMITLESGSEYKFASADEKQFFSSLEEAKRILGADKQVVVKEIYPTIKGAIIVCSGASNVKVSLDILKAVQVLLNIPSGNIEILQGN